MHFVADIKKITANQLCNFLADQLKNLNDICVLLCSAAPVLPLEVCQAFFAHDTHGLTICIRERAATRLQFSSLLP
jgi:hypothetical protein